MEQQPDRESKASVCGASTNQHHNPKNLMAPQQQLAPQKPAPQPQPTLGPSKPEPKVKYDFPIATAIANGWGTASLAAIALALISLPAMAQPGCNGTIVDAKPHTLCLTATANGEARVDLMGSTVSVVRLLGADRRPMATTTMTGKHTRTVPDNASLPTIFNTRSAIGEIAKVSHLANAIVTNPKAKSYLGF
jgi:hypothetical protein